MEKNFYDYAVDFADDIEIRDWLLDWSEFSRIQA